MESMEAFANRLMKMSRHFDKWARRKGITCYRVYDADLTGFPLAIDRYADMVHVAEYQRSFPGEEEAYLVWRRSCKSVISEILEVPLTHLFYKERAPQKGSNQYEKRGERGKEIVVSEGSLKFLINMEDYLDTGLFLDHRQTRDMLRERAKGKKVLNLFAYTGSFTVYAASGGAKETLSLDMSNTYLDWTRRNLILNGFKGSEHRLERVDVLDWLREKPRGLYDMIILDPPTFSNSKMMREILDIQRDHPGLIEACMMRLAPDGELWFSTNHRKFRLEEKYLPSWVEFREITAQTIPPDFRNGKIHRCWIFKGR